MSEEIKAVRELIASLPNTAEMSIHEFRAFMDKTAASLHLPREVLVEMTDVDGISGEWVKALKTINDYAILYLHGGGYVAGSTAFSRQLAAYISTAAEAPLLSLNYRLAPEHPFPAALDDAVNGYHWLVEKGISPDRIAIAGDSAGGGLTIAALLVLRDAGDRLPAAGICISPWVDLTCSAESFKTKADSDPLVRQKECLRFAAMYLGDKDPKTPFASPIFADLTGLPPLLIQVGSEEVLLDDAISFDRRARQAGVESTLEIWEDMIHVWHSFAPMLKEGHRAIERIGQFFKMHRA